MKNNYRSVFDIIGPVMVGPSSSHTAGAARIGKVVRQIFGETPTEIKITLYESFAKTYKGHGTDVALIGGILDMAPDDERLGDSLKIAEEQGIKVTFIPSDGAADHPNTAEITVSKGNHELTVLGSSIGGGAIRISEVDGFKINLSQGVPTFLIVHQDEPGLVSAVTEVLVRQQLNISTMSVSRAAKGGRAIMVIEVDQVAIGNALNQLSAIPNLHEVSFFN